MSRKVIHLLSSSTYAIKRTMKKQKKHVHGYYQLIVRLDEEDKERLKRYAEQEKKQQTTVVRELIREYCVDYEND